MAVSHRRYRTLTTVSRWNIRVHDGNIDNRLGIPDFLLTLAAVIRQQRFLDCSRMPTLIILGADDAAAEAEVVSIHDDAQLDLVVLARAAVVEERFVAL